MKQLIHIEGEAYDVAAWAKKHPGGEVLLRFLGRDATAAFIAFHGARARKTLKPFKAREAAEAPPVPESAHAAEQEFAALRSQAERDGRFVANTGYFARRVAVILGLVAAAAATCALAPALWPLAALALGVAWQQAGWASHDYLHHSVYEDRKKGDLAGIALGGVVLGFSADWWKRKHNTHHALPNVVGADPDIDVLPLLAFTEDDLPRAGSFARWMVRLQPVTAVPVVAMARLNWIAQSALWAMFAPGVRHRRLELASLAAHHAWSLGLLVLLPTWGARVGFFLAAQLASGLMTGAVFLVGHNARPMVAREDAPGFYALQVLATQNVRAARGTRWFFGGLDRQIEHHLFPSMPRHAHDAVSPAVREIAARHGIPYTERGFFRGLADVGAVLVRVSRAAWVRG